MRCLVSLHQYFFLRLGQFEQFACLIASQHQGRLAEHVLSSEQRFLALAIVAKVGRGDIHAIYIVEQGLIAVIHLLYLVALCEVGRPCRVDVIDTAHPHVVDKLRLWREALGDPSCPHDADAHILLEVLAQHRR